MKILQDFKSSIRIQMVSSRRVGTLSYMSMDSSFHTEALIFSFRKYGSKIPKRMLRFFLLVPIGEANIFNIFNRKFLDQPSPELLYKNCENQDHVLFFFLDFQKKIFGVILGHQVLLVECSGSLHPDVS